MSPSAPESAVLPADTAPARRKHRSGATLSTLAALVLRTGRIAESSPPAPARSPSNAPWQAKARRLRGSMHVRYVDAGGGHDCGLELQAALGPVYDVERYGIHLVASPRHADVLLVAGCVTRNMASPLRNTFESMPAPRIVVAAGDAAIDGGCFRDAYGVVGPVSAVIPVDLEIPGDPPTPADIVAALRQISGR
ncbi:NADH-quinone oxidoreductase subunit B family protein [Gordonia sp. NPDC003424]